MNYKSKAVPVVASQFNSLSSIPNELAHKYVILNPILKVVSGNITSGGSRDYVLRPELGGTVVEDGDWIVEFPNGEVHVVTDKRFKLRFEEVKSYTPEEVKTAVSMAKRWHEMGGESS